MRDTGETPARSPTRRPALHQRLAPAQRAERPESSLPTGMLLRPLCFHVPVTTTPGDGRRLPPVPHDTSGQSSCAMSSDCLSASIRGPVGQGARPSIRGRTRKARQGLCVQLERRAGCMGPSGPGEHSRASARRSAPRTATREQRRCPRCTTCGGTPRFPCPDLRKRLCRGPIERGAYHVDQTVVVRRSAWSAHIFRTMYHVYHVDPRPSMCMCACA